MFSSKYFNMIDKGFSLKNLNEQQVKILNVDFFTKRYGWQFVKDNFEISKLDASDFQYLGGIFESENKLNKINEQRMNKK